MGIQAQDSVIGNRGCFETMSDRDRRPSEPAGLDGLPPLYSIAKGEVVSVQTYGAFVRLPGYRKEGQWKDLIIQMKNKEK